MSAGTLAAGARGAHLGEKLVLQALHPLHVYVHREGAVPDVRHLAAGKHFAVSKAGGAGI